MPVEWVRDHRYKLDVVRRGARHCPRGLRERGERLGSSGGAHSGWYDDPQHGTAGLLRNSVRTTSNGNCRPHGCIGRPGVRRLHVRLLVLLDRIVPDELVRGEPTTATRRERERRVGGWTDGRPDPVVGEYGRCGSTAGGTTERREHLSGTWSCSAACGAGATRPRSGRPLSGGVLAEGPPSTDEIPVSDDGPGARDNRVVAETGGRIGTVAGGPMSALQVALLGCGVVGSQVARLLTEHAEDLAARVGASLELVGDSVVSANKALLAEDGTALHAAAEKHGVDLYYEAAVAGAIPLLRPLRESLAGDRIRRVLGIVNGTTNYILDRMDSTGAGFTEALEEAQALGYAEPDPTADVDGFDAAAKAAILASIAFHTPVVTADVHREGIADVTAADVAGARDIGAVVKLLAVCELAGDERSVGVRVHPAMLPREHPLASVRGPYNAVFVES